MADPLNGVYKARQSPRFSPVEAFGPRHGGRLNNAPERGASGPRRSDPPVRDPSIRRPEEIGS
jgi:hypothetical protein